MSLAYFSALQSYNTHSLIISITLRSRLSLTQKIVSLSNSCKDPATKRCYQSSEVISSWWLGPGQKLSASPTFAAVVVADVLDGVPDHLLVVHDCLGGDLPAHHHHAGLGHSLASNLGTKQDDNTEQQNILEQ